MLLIHGVYHWKARRVGFRNDYCRFCAAERLAALVRTLDVLHLFWVPLIPLGVWSRWHCTVCGSRPHESPRTRRGFKVAGAVVLAVMGLLMWAVPVEEIEEPWAIWALRFALPVATVAAARSAARHRREPRLAELLARVSPFAGWVCPLCGGQLLDIPRSHCTACRAEHRPLRIEAAAGPPA
jgi:hypothetical protein